MIRNSPKPVAFTNMHAHIHTHIHSAHTHTHIYTLHTHIHSAHTHTHIYTLHTHIHTNTLTYTYIKIIHTHAIPADYIPDWVLRYLSYRAGRPSCRDCTDIQAIYLPHDVGSGVHGWSETTIH